MGACQRCSRESTNKPLNTQAQVRGQSSWVCAASRTFNGDVSQEQGQGSRMRQQGPGRVLWQVLALGACLAVAGGGDQTQHDVAAGTPVAVRWGSYATAKSVRKHTVHARCCPAPARDCLPLTYQTTHNAMRRLEHDHGAFCCANERLPDRRPSCAVARRLCTRALRRRGGEPRQLCRKTQPRAGCSPSADLVAGPGRPRRAWPGRTATTGARPSHDRSAGAATADHPAANAPASSVRGGQAIWMADLAHTGGLWLRPRCVFGSRGACSCCCVCAWHMSSFSSCAPLMCRVQQCSLRTGYKCCLFPATCRCADECLWHAARHVDCDQCACAPHVQTT
jgi:hypothetical protein